MRMRARGTLRLVAILVSTAAVAGAADRLAAQKLGEPAAKPETGIALPDRRPPPTIQRAPDDAAVVEIERRLIELQNEDNELRKEILLGRSKLVDRWLDAVAVLQTMFVIVLAIAGFFGFRRFRDIEKEARESASAAQLQAEKAANLADDIKATKQQADSILDSLKNTTSESVDDNPEKADEAARSVQENPAATFVDRAIANAILLQGSGNFEAAIEKWRSIAILSEETDQGLAARSWFSVGYLRQEMSDMEAAITAYDRALQMDPGSAPAYNNRGVAKSGLKRYEEAVADYGEAIRLRPDNAEAYNNRGVAKSDLGRHEEALADYGEAIRLKPDYAEAYNNRGIARRNLERYEEAIADYDEAIRLRPDFIATYYDRARANMKLGHASKARQDFMTMLALAQEKGDEKLASAAKEVLETSFDGNE